MGKVERFEDLYCWKLSRELYREISKLISEGRFKGEFRFISQLDSSAGSIMDNIAEGFERSGKKEFRQFLFIAKGSCGELRSQLYRCLERAFISEAEFKTLYRKATHLGYCIFKLIQYLNQTSHNGDKYITE